MRSRAAFHVRGTEEVVSRTGIETGIDGSSASSLLWKNDGNATGAPVDIWAQPLSADGLTLTGELSRLHGADQEWEHGLIEGPAVLAASKGDWWLLSSGGTWQSNTHDTDVAWCSAVLGRCQKPAEAPLWPVPDGGVPLRLRHLRGQQRQALGVVFRFPPAHSQS